MYRLNKPHARLLSLILLTILSPGSLIAAEMEAVPGEKTTHTYAPLPRGVASFGAAVDGDWLYVYGGHVGKTHQHSIENLDHAFRRLDLRNGGDWQDLGPVPGLQGLAVVTYGGKIYRVGGLSARNHEGETEDLHSVADFARFDPRTGLWEDLAPLPEGRSSHFAAVDEEGKLFVVGGWRLAGPTEEARWHTSAYVADLGEADPRWLALPEPPFRRRALAVAATRGKVYALGGLSEERTSNAVFVYDSEERAWSRGPILPLFQGLKGFGASAFAVSGRVYISGLDGTLYRLNEDGSAWEKTSVEAATPRFFHQMVPHGDQKMLLVAGASREGHERDIEVLDLASLEIVPDLPVLAQHAALVADPVLQWPGFRGRGTSHAVIEELPMHWSEVENLAWRIDLPGYGQSSPVIWGRQAFVTSALGSKKEVLVTSSVDLEDGKIRWRRRLPASREIEAAEHVSRAAPSPAVDAEHLFVFFESGDLFAFDHEGNDLWKRSLMDEYGDFKGNHGVASSLALSEEAVIVLVAHEGPSYLLSVDKKTGENRWKVDRPEKVSWSTPVVSSYDGREEILVSAAGRAEAYDAENGELLWFVEGIEKNHIPSPSVTGDLVIVGSSENGHSQAIRRGGRGNVTETHVVWRAEGAASSFGSPLVHGGCVYYVNRAGVLRCVDVETGESRWDLRLAAGCWASPIAVGDYAYFFSKDGTTTILKSDPEAPHKLNEALLTGGGNVYGVAADEEGFLIRTGTKLARIRQQEDPSTKTSETASGASP